MNQLTKGQIEKIRDAIFELVRKSSSKRAKLVQSGEIKRPESLKIANLENQLQRKADQLNRVLLGKIVEDIQSAGQKIVMATNKVKIAIDKLQEANQFIFILSTFFNVVSTIISTAQSGNILNLANLLAPIENLNT